MLLRRHVSIAVLIAGSLFGVGTFEIASAQVQRSQIVLDNQTASAADLYVDGIYACRALARLMCVTQVKAGQHDLTAGSHSKTITVEEGKVFTWRIS